MAEGVLPAIRLRPRVQRWIHVAPIILRSRAAAVLFLALLPIGLYIQTIAQAVAGERSGSDFLSFWEAGKSVLHGSSPYPLLDTLPAVADRFTFAPFVYPAPAAFGMVPFAVLPFAVATTLFLALSCAAIVVALRLLGVDDWRCYGAVFASVPVIAGTALGAFSPLLLLGAAAAWRYRDHALRVGPIVAALVVMKLFLWPVWLWLVFTRRFAAAALAASLGLVATLGAWALIGFAGLRDYPHLLSRLTELVGINSYSPYALLRTEGFGSSMAQRLVLAIGVALIAWAAFALRAVRTDERAFVATLGIALLLTPILWPHYLVLIYIPIALVRKSFSKLWLLPLLFWFDGNGWSDGEAIRIVPALCLAAVPFVMVLRRAE
jgi:alpha-1,2-mannosyltransferase